MNASSITNKVHLYAAKKGTQAVTLGLKGVGYLQKGIEIIENQLVRTAYWLGGPIRREEEAQNKEFTLRN